MLFRKNKFLRILVALCLVCTMITPICVSAAVIPSNGIQASNYLAGYHGYIYRSGSTVQICFSVSGTTTMKDIGALSIQLFESTDGVNYYWVETFLHESTSGMLAHNTSYHAGIINYSGYSNRYYKAYIGVYAGQATGDSRYIWAY